MNLEPTYNMLIEINKRILLIVPEKRKTSIEQKLNEGKNYLTLEWNSGIIEYLLMIIDLIIQNNRNNMTTFINMDHLILVNINNINHNNNKDIFNQLTRLLHLVLMIIILLQEAS